MGAVAGGLGWAGERVGVCCVAVGCTAIALRRAPVRVLAALLVGGFGLGVVAAAARADEGAGLEQIAATVPDCRVAGSVLESAGGLGTFVSIEHASCDEVTYVDAGVAVADLAAPAGSPFTADAWLLPLGDDGFDRARRRAGAAAELSIQEVEVSPPTGAFAFAARIRTGMVAATEPMDRDEAGLLRGLTIGDTEDISLPVLDAFRRSGLSHLVAVSGSNVAIVLAGVAWLTGRLPLYVRMTICGAALMVFVLVVGPDGSVLRAAAMGAIALVAVVAGRHTEPLHVLGSAVALLIAIRPSSVFSLGLHLSVAATAGIVLWAPRLNARLHLPDIVSLPLAVTLGAQLGVLPLLAVAFGEVSAISPLSNLAVAPAVAPATVLGFIAGLAATVWAPAGALVARIAEPFVSWIVFVAELSARPTWAAVPVPPPLAWATAAAVGTAALWALKDHGRPITLDG